jgi:hypothetical protein
MLTQPAGETIRAKCESDIMLQIKLVGVACALVGLAFQSAEVKTMTRMNVRLMGPGIRPGSNAALPKLIYRAGTKYARMEDAPEARQRIEKVTIIAEPDAYSVDLMGRTGTHAIDQGGANDMHLPMVLPLDPNHKLGILDHLEFGAELDFFQKAGATKSAGPIINAKPTDLYTLNSGGSKAQLITRDNSDVPVFVSFTNKDGTYKYEYSTYQEVPFDASLFARPRGIKFREIPPAGLDEGK